MTILAFATLAKRAGLAAAAALAVNLLIWAAGQAAGASFSVQLGGRTTEVGPPIIAVQSVVPLLLGALVTWLVVRGARRGGRALQVLGLVFAVLSLVSPLTADTDGLTRLFLAPMHLVVGLAFAWAVSPLARRSEDAGSGS